MKKYVMLLVMVIVLLGVTACSSQREMTLEPAQLDQKEEKLKSLLCTEEKPLLLDFSVEDSMKSVRVQFYELDKQGKWKKGTQLNEAVGGSGRIAVVYNGEGGLKYMALQSGEDETAVFSNKGTDKELKAGRIKTETGLQEKAIIASDKEIPVFIGILSSKEHVETYDVNTYFEPEKYKGHDKVYAATVTFSEKGTGERK